MQLGKHTYHTTIYTDASFFSAPFFSSKMASPLLIPAFSSIPKYPISLLQSWATLSTHPMMCHPPRQKLPWSERFWGELQPVTHGDGGDGLHAHTLELRLCCDSPRQVVCYLYASLIWVRWAWMFWWLLWWAWKQPGRVWFCLLPCHWFSELLCRCADRHFFSEPDTLYSHPLSK